MARLRVTINDELMKKISACVRQIWPNEDVGAMSRFVSGSEALRADLAAILKGSAEDAPGLIKSFRTAALSGDIAVLAIDRRIQADAVWSGWVRIFLREGRDLCRPSRPVTHWEFPESQIAEGNGSSICRWLFRRS